MSDQFLRQISMLQMIPRYPRKISAPEIKEHLDSLGYHISKRSIERDLDKLSSGYLPLTCDDRSKPYGWSWAKDSELFDLPGMDSGTALSFYLIKEYVSPMLPHSVLETLAPHFHRAEQLLDKMPKPGPANWPSKIRVLPRTQKLLPAEMDEDVLRVIYDALLAEHQISADYTKRNNKMPETYRLNPLALVFRDSVAYLLATSADENTVKQFALHRFSEARLLEDIALIPRSFSIDKYIKDGNFDYLTSDKNIELHVLFDKAVAAHLEETPISAKQTLSAQKDGRVLLKASVLDTSQLRWWLMGFGAQVEVVKPTSLRIEFKENANGLKRLYF